MADEAQEIDRIHEEHGHGLDILGCLVCQSLALARRLLAERDEALESAESSKQLHKIEHDENLRTRGLGTPEEIIERIASLERERDEARQKHNDHCRTTEVCYFTEKWK